MTKVTSKFIWQQIEHIYFKKVSTDKILFYIQLNDGAKEYTVSL